MLWIGMGLGMGLWDVVLLVVVDRVMVVDDVSKDEPDIKPDRPANSRGIPHIRLILLFESPFFRRRLGGKPIFPFCSVSHLSHIIKQQSWVVET